MDALRGSSAQKVKQFGLDRLSEYGVLRGMPVHMLRKVLHKLYGMQLLKQQGDPYPVVKITPEGKELSSEAFAQKLSEIKLSGKSSVCFLIGSSFGMAPRVKQRADFRLSMGPMTFPHHLARIMVLEQLYRAEAIQSGSRYHK